MKISVAFGVGVSLGLLLLCSCATQPSAHSSLPPDVNNLTPPPISPAANGPLPPDQPINPDAGRGGVVIVTVQLEDGRNLPMVLDTGASATLLDGSLRPTFGKRLGSAVLSWWYTNFTSTIYEAPRLYLGGSRLMMTGSNICTGSRWNGPLQCASSVSGRRIMGILGMDVLEHYCIQLDFAAGKMRFLDDRHADKSTWGKAFPILPRDQDTRPAVAENLLGMQGSHSTIDSGCLGDGWLRPAYFQQWTNETTSPTNGALHWPVGMFGGEKYPLSLDVQNVKDDGIGIDFLARHLVTFDFPNQTVYLRRQSIGPLPDPKMADYQPIPDPEPEVAAHVRAMVQDWIAGAEHAGDYNAWAWKDMLTKQTDMQAYAKTFGSMVSLTLVERKKGWSLSGRQRSYRYRVEFTKATVLAHFVFDGRNKLLSGNVAVSDWHESP